MGYVQPNRAGVGELISAAFAELVGIKRKLTLYVLAVLALSLLLTLQFPFQWILNLAMIPAYFVGQYLIYQTMLRRSGLLRDGRRRVSAFAGMAIVLIIPIVIGTYLVVIPGIILVAKWIMAPAYLVSQPLNVFEAIGKSWRTSEGNTLNLALAFTVIFLIWAVAGGAIGAVLDIAAGLGSVGFARAVPIHLLPLLMAGLAVAAFRLLAGNDNQLAEVFA